MLWLKSLICNSQGTASSLGAVILARGACGGREGEEEEEGGRVEEVCICEQENNVIG